VSSADAHDVRDVSAGKYPLCFGEDMRDRVAAPEPAVYERFTHRWFTDLDAFEQFWMSHRRAQHLPDGAIGHLVVDALV
jgi:hypothetical protein